MRKKAVMSVVLGSPAPIMLKNFPQGITPAATAQITVALASRKGPGIPSAAIQPRGGRAVAFVVNDAEVTNSRKHPNKVEAVLFRGLAASSKGKSDA